jgi:hypothetical protein
MSGSPKRVGLKDPAFTRQCGKGRPTNLDLGNTTLWLLVVERSRRSRMCERHGAEVIHFHSTWDPVYVQSWP